MTRVSDEFRAEVARLRDEGWTWPEVAELTGVSQRTCSRALASQKKVCAHRGCAELANLNGALCPEHSRAAMASKAGHGPRQRHALRVVRRKGLATSKDIQDATGMTANNTGQVLSRLVRLGLLERPVTGYYRIPGETADGTRRHTTGRMVGQ